MRPAIAPPLPAGVAARGEHQRLTVGRRSTKELTGVAIGGHRQRRPTASRHAIHIVHPGDVLRRAIEVQPATIARPRRKRFGRVVVGQTGQRARAKVQHVQIAIPGTIAHKRQRRSVGRIQRARLRGGMRHEQPRLTAGGGHRPNITTAHKRDFPTVGGERGLCQRRRGGRGLRQRAVGRGGKESSRSDKEGGRDWQHATTLRGVRRASREPANHQLSHGGASRLRPHDAWAQRRFTLNSRHQCGGAQRSGVGHAATHPAWR